MKRTFTTVLSTVIMCCSLANVQAQTISTIAGTGVSGFSGDGGPATAAQLNLPWGMALDKAQNLYVTDCSNNRVRMISTSGVITTIAGTGVSGYGGDGGPATTAQFQGVSGIAIDKYGNIFLSENTGHRIRKIDPAGIITTYAGSVSGFGGDGGAATAAKISSPNEVAVDTFGNVYIPDQSNNRVRKVTTSGIISTIAGTSSSGYSGDGGAATNAKMFLPNDIVVSPSGDVYVAENINNVIRMITPAGIISTFAGTNILGFSGDGGPATAAKVHGLAGLCLNGAGEMLLCDQDNQRIRKIDASGIINTIAGTGVSGFSGDGGMATSANIKRPNKVIEDKFGNIYIADMDNHRIRKITAVPIPNVAPAFVDGSTKTVFACQGVATDISYMFSITDPDLAQTETWSAGTAPAHGSLAASYTTTSTGGTLIPTGIIYTPAGTYSGTDVFTVEISDGTATIIATVNVTVNPMPSIGVITGIDSV
ncbi:MAG: repeat containing protein, partial [Flavipsychrobacter sp.]|nr:repeat containing protein [Flavipsychrobacter sp.]